MGSKARSELYLSICNKSAKELQRRTGPLTPQQIQQIQLFQAQRQATQQAQLARTMPVQQQQQQQASMARGVQKRTSISLTDGDSQLRMAKRRKATDRYLPSFLPEQGTPTQESDEKLHTLSSAYSKLQALERKLDWTISRKKVDFQESLGLTGLHSSTNKGGKLTKYHKELRLVASHTLDEEAQTWTFTLDARLDDVPDKKFSQLISSASISWSKPDGSEASEAVTVRLIRAIRTI
jgi:hypothetical protein